MKGSDIDNLEVHVVWSSQLGAKSKHVGPAAKLMRNPRAAHYWDPELRVGTAVQRRFEGLEAPAWDVWMLFAPGVVWERGAFPEPTWWEHQLDALSDREDRWLEPKRFADKAVELSGSEG